jgi:type IV pilus assembly protein PilO
MAAASGAMADFGRLPTSRKILLFVGIGLLAGFLYHRLVYKSLDASVEKAKNVLKVAGEQNAALDNDAKLFGEFRAKKEEYDYIIRENQKALPTESEVPAFFETLERKITESGVEIIKWSKRPEEPVESFVKVPLDVELSGSFLQIKRFFASLAEKKQKSTPVDNKGGEERERIVSIENLALTTPAVRNREIILTAKFTAVTFRQADAVAPAAGSPSKAPSAAPAGGTSAPAMPSTPNAPPMPSAGTPAGAKARTEDALNKDQQRRDGAVEKANGGSGSDRLKGGL